MLLERERELGQLAGFLDAASESAGAAAIIVGPAGIGKTSLLEAAREAAEERKLRLLTARGGELERDFAYGVVRQLLERPLRELSVAQRRAVLDGAAAQAAAVVGVAPDGPEAGSDSPFAVVHALYWVCVNLSARQPLAMFIDDLHWADAASLRFLAYLVRRVEELPVAVVTAARPPLQDERTELVEALVGAREVHGIELAPLSEAAVGEIVGSSLGSSQSTEVTHGCWQATAGNPFLCKALASALAERGLDPGSSDLAALAGQAISDLVVASLGRLPDDAAALARAVAVLGTDADLRQAATLAELGERDAAAAADALAAQGVLTVGRPLEFVHPLVRAAVAERIPPAERLLAHTRAARVVFDAGASADAVAAHLLAAEPAADRWAVEQLLNAARSAVARGAPEQALSSLGRALREPPPADLRVDVLHELGATEIQSGRPELAIEHLQEALALADDVVRRANVTRNLASAFSVRGDYEGAVAVLGETLAELGDDQRELKLDLEGQRYLFLFLAPGAVSEPPQDRSMDEIHGRTPGERAYLTSLLLAGFFSFEPPERIRHWAELALEGGLSDDVTSAAIVWHNVMYPLTFAGCFELARRAIGDGLERAQELGSALGASRAYASRAMLHLREGALREATADGRTAIETGRQLNLASHVITVGVLAETLASRGRFEEADAVLAEAGLDGEIPLHFLHNWVLYGRGYLRLRQGRGDDAIADFRELGRRGEHWQPWTPAIFPYRSGLALALRASGENGEAHTLAEEELELSRRARVPHAIGLSLRTLGLCEGGERGLKLLRESVEILEKTGARLEQARSLVELGAAIRRSGKRSEAREPLHAGMELAHKCGADPMVELAREELRATGARPRRIVRTGVDALTPSELRVARMAAEGLSNPQIAQALFVTLRTVEVHLTHAYQKLDISSREELPEALAEDSEPEAET